MVRPDSQAAPGSFRPSESRETLHLRFASHYVTLSSASPEVSSAFRSWVALMLDANPEGTCVGKLRVDVLQESFRVLGPEAVDTYDCDNPESAANHLFHAAMKLLMAARPDLLWLHGGVAARGGRATLLCGRPGAGKSTLVADLLARGWTYFSDEFAVVEPRTATVFPFAIAPSMRVGDGRMLRGADEVRGLRKVPIATPARHVGRTPVPVDGVYFVSYDAGASVVRLADCSPAEGVLEMLNNSLGDSSSREREIRGMCDLLSRVPSARLTYAHARDATDRIDAGFTASPPVRPGHATAAHAISASPSAERSGRRNASRRRH